MDDVFIFIEQQFRTHFVQTLIITVAMGVIVVSLFALAIMRSNRQRAEPYPEPSSVPKFGPDMTLPHPLHDEIAKRDRDLEKWREEHKAQL
jgi:hypothetical protein